MRSNRVADWPRRKRRRWCRRNGHPVSLRVVSEDGTAIDRCSCETMP